MGFLVRSVVNGFAFWVLSLIPFLQITITPFAPGRDLQMVLTLIALGAHAHFFEQIVDLPF